MTESPGGRLRPAGHEEQGEVITSPHHIEALIQRTVSERLFVTVRLPGLDTDYNSTILEVDHDRGEFLLDELYPEDGHRRLQQLWELRLYARLDGAQLSLTSTVRGLGEEGGLTYYRVRIPERVNYYQRRRFHRVDADRIIDVEVRLDDGAEGVPRRGRLHDLSEGGISLWLEPEVAETLRLPWKVPYCEVRFPGDEPLACAIEVRNVRYVEARGECIAGGRFLFDDPRMRQRVARLVAALERRLLRQRQDGDG